jgi:hypothetical protein
LLSVNVGLPRDIAWQGKTVHTSVWKAAVQGPRFVRRLNIDGDRQGDLAGHGGEHRAVFVCQIAASAYIDEKVQIGDVLEISAPRGDFILRAGDGPVVLQSAGVGATPVLAMLYALAAEASRREIWWLHGARNGREHPFAAEARSLLKTMARGHSHIRKTSPGPEDRPG